MPASIPANQTNALGQPIGYDVPGWTPRAEPPATQMVGRTVTLEPLSASQHGDDLFDAFAADESGAMWTYLAIGPFAQDRSGFDTWMQQCEASRDPLFFACRSAETGRTLGYASYLRIEPPVGVIEVGHITFGSELQRTVMATEAMYLMMRRVFDELGYRRYEWKCDAANVKSRAAAERLGFTYEGTFRQATLYKGRNRDTAWFSILDGEWPEIRDRFERWLAVDNFDAEGRQKSSLNSSL